MKQTIEFYYNIKIDSLEIIKDNYHFVYDNKDFYFLNYKRSNEDLNQILECQRELINLNIPVHKMIYNNKGSLLTTIDDACYILLKVDNKEENYSIVDILEYNKKLKLKNSISYQNNWVELWKQKIDYLESKLSEVEYSKQIYYSFDYFIGLCETAIYYVNVINNKYQISKDDSIVLSRKRIYYPNNNLNYFNPLGFIFDLEVRDVSEYLKAIFFNNEDAFLELTTYLKCVRLSFYSYNMLFARLIFPTYYLDLLEKNLNKKEKVDFLNIIDKQKDYEKFLKFAYTEISKYAPLENINYLIFEH